MKSIWIAVLLVVNAVIVNAQFELTGTVKDHKGQAMIGANVYIDKTLFFLTVYDTKKYQLL